MTDAATAGSLADGATIEQRESRLSRGASALAAGGRRTLLRNPHLLVTVAATLMTAGIVCILIAWFGIARSTMVEEQLAYLVSGGILGLALAVIGALAFFTHWLTVLIRTTQEQTELLREARDHEAARQRDHQELMTVLRQQAAGAHEQEDTDGRARSATPRRPVRRAPRGS